MTTRDAAAHLASYPRDMRVVDAPRLVMLHKDLQLTDLQVAYWLMLEAHGYIQLLVS